MKKIFNIKQTIISTEVIEKDVEGESKTLKR